MVQAQIKCLQATGASLDETTRAFLTAQGWWLALQHVRAGIEDIQHGRTEWIDAMLAQMSGNDQGDGNGTRGDIPAQPIGR